MKSRSEIEKLWRYEKYNVMMHSQKAYLDIRESLKGNLSYEALEFKIKTAKKTEPTKGSIMNTFDHMWGYFKKIATNEEKAQYIKYKEQFQRNHISAYELLQFIHQLAVKYEQTYLLESTILH